MEVRTADALAVRERSGSIDGPASDEGHSTSASMVVSASDAPVWVGVERSPPNWFRQRVTVLEPSLDLPNALTETLHERRQDLQRRGLCKTGAHNAAWEELSVDERYREYLRSETTDGALERLRAFERPVVLASARHPGVRCHRVVLADWLTGATE